MHLASEKRREHSALVKSLLKDFPERTSHKEKKIDLLYW